MIVETPDGPKLAWELADQADAGPEAPVCKAPKAGAEDGQDEREGDGVVVAAATGPLQGPCGGAEAWRQRHERMAGDLYELLMQVRCEGAQRFQDGMRGLWQAAEAADSAARAGTGAAPQGLLESVPLAHLIYKIAGEDAAAEGAWHQAKAISRLLSFRELCSDLRGDVARAAAARGRQAQALRKLLPVLAGSLAMPEVRPLARQPLGIERGLVELAPELCEMPAAWAVLPLVWLPLALYVRSTAHLYEMLERLQLRAPGGGAAPDAQGPDALPQGPDGLRGLLDRDERRYSYLVFAVIAALQTLFLARARLGRHFPLELLASHPPGQEEQEHRYRMAAKGEWPEAQLIFRGIWVGAAVDEERARFQYSFQSFSREVSGMSKVLCFYAGARGSPPAGLAVAHNHVLVFVARVRWSEPGCLAMPVQFFDGPRNRRSELEVLLPPYVCYELEEDLSLTTEEFEFAGPLPSARAKLAELRSRWTGFELPEDLLGMLRRAPYPEEFEELEILRPFVTVRFVRRVLLPGPMGRLYGDPRLHLYRFGPGTA